MHLDKQHPRPVYLQLKDLLQQQIEQGYYFSHQQLPSERDLCQLHNLSRMTVRKALKALISDGYAYARAGKGTFVSDLAGKASKSRPGASKIPGLSDWHSTQPQYWQKLIDPLLSFDCVGAEVVISEMLAVHSLEIVASKLFPEIIKYLEQQWQTGHICLPAHNFAITTVRSQLIAMVNAASMARYNPKILLGCAPGDQHEIGLLLLALSLRRRGFQVIYMGPNLSPEEFHQIIETGQPALICLSAATEPAAGSLKALASSCAAEKSVRLTTNGAPENFKPWLTFGGVAFSQNPNLIAEIPGIYLGNSIENAVNFIEHLVLPPGQSTLTTRMQPDLRQTSHA